LTSKGFKTRKLKCIFIPNLYQIYTNVIQFIQCYFPHHFLVRRRRRDVKNPDTFAFDRFIPPTLLYNTLLQRFSTALLSKTSLQHHSARPFSTPPPTPFYDTLLQHFSTTPFENNLHSALSNQHCHAPLEPFPLTLLYSTLLQHLSTVDILP